MSETRSDRGINTDFMTLGWAGLVEWAITQPQIVGRFEAETGIKMPKPRTALDKMIDEATGHSPGSAGAEGQPTWIDRDHFCLEFTVWVTKRLWGSGDGVPVDIWARCEREMKEEGLL